MKFFRLSRKSPILLRPKKGIRPKVELLEDRTVPSVTLGANFVGLSSNDTSCNCQPPDDIAAAGTNHLVEMVNTAIRITDKAGNIQSTQELSSFFSSVFTGPNQSDPFVMYDEAARRFIAGVLDYVNGSTPNNLDFAVSSVDGRGPLTWTFQNYSVGEGSFFADYPRAGLNADAYFVGFNMFATSGSGSFSHVQELIINKSTLAVSSQNDLSTSLFTVTPALMHGAVTGGPEYFVEAINGGGSTINVVTATNVLSSSPAFTTTAISVPAYKSAPAPRQPHGKNIASFDTRIFNAAWRNNHLVAAHQVGLSGSRLGFARWYDFDTSGTAPVLFQDGNQAGVSSGSTAFMPTVDINSVGSIGLNFAESSKSQFWSTYVTARTTAMALGTMQAPVEAGVGTSTSPDSRVGDYSGLTVDPTNDSFWAIQQYQTPVAFWDSYVANFSVSGTAAAVPANNTGASVLVAVPPPAASQAVTPEQNVAGISLTVWSMAGTVGALPANNTGTSVIVTAPALPPSQTVTPEQNVTSISLTEASGPLAGSQIGSQALGAATGATPQSVDAVWADLANLDFLRIDGQS
jgi:hypothetical protein